MNEIQQLPVTLTQSELLSRGRESGELSLSISQIHEDLAAARGAADGREGPGADRVCRVTHRLLDARFLETACGLLTTPGSSTLRFTIAGEVTCRDCLDAKPIVPVTPHPGATP